MYSERRLSQSEMAEPAELRKALLKEDKKVQAFPSSLLQYQRVPQSIQRCFTPVEARIRKMCRLAFASAFVDPLIRIVRLSSLPPERKRMSSTFLFKETGLGAFLPAIREAFLQMYGDEREIENHFWHTVSI